MQAAKVNISYAMGLFSQLEEYIYKKKNTVLYNLRFDGNMYPLLHKIHSLKFNKFQVLFQDVISLISSIQASYIHFEDR